MSCFMDKPEAIPQVGQPESQPNRVLVVGVPIGPVQLSVHYNVLTVDVAISWNCCSDFSHCHRVTRTQLQFLSILFLSTPGFTKLLYSCLQVTFTEPFCSLFTVKFSPVFFLCPFLLILFLSYVSVIQHLLNKPLSIVLLAHNFLPWLAK